MSDALYDSGRNAFLTGSINWVSDAIGVILVDAADYTVDLANHNYLSDIPAGARVAAASIVNKTASAGIADADDSTFFAVSGDPSEALIIYKDTGNEATSQLIAYIDTATGLPVTPNGGDIVIAWPGTGSKIFKL